MVGEPPSSPVPSLRQWKARRVLCLKTKHAVASSWGVGTQDVTIWECPVSGLRFREPTSHEDVEAFYDAEYHEKMTGVGGKRLRRLAYRKENDSRVEHLLRHLPEGRVLDVGCSRGDFAEALSRAGFDTYGLDISVDACEKSRATLGEDRVFCSTLKELAEQRTQRFTAITAMDVIEHCTDPVEFLGAAHALLKKDGILFLRTPTLSSPFHAVGSLSYKLTLGLYKTPLFKLYHAEHLYFFNELSMRRILQDCGFDVLEIAPDPLNWDNFRTAELRQGALGNLLLSGIYFAGRVFRRGHGMKVIARKRESTSAASEGP
jgi:2-polyprenyl-3-methyl-5-hydroxy-6-metoxy-1,4-benzoquinol methylase